MDNVLTVDDARYKALFDVGNEAASMGNVADFDTNSAMNALRARGPVLHGGLRELLDIKGRKQYDRDRRACANRHRATGRAQPRDIRSRRTVWFVLRAGPFLTDCLHDWRQCR